MVKNPLINAGDLGSIPGSGRSTGGKNGAPLQCFCLGNPINRGVCWATRSPWGGRVGHDLATELNEHKAHVYVSNVSFIGDRAVSLDPQERCVL